MIQTIPAQTIELHDLIENFGLQRTEDEQFFREWQDNLPELTDLEKQALDDVKRDYFHLAEYPMLEPIVKMVVLSPLLKLAGFYRPPFYLAAEKEVRISFEDEGITITGRLDILVFTPEFWILVVESKRAKLSLETGIPQALAYMLGNPNADLSGFGFVTNGSEFRFLKLTREGTTKYATSHLFSLDRGNDIYTVLRVLKRLAQLFSSPGV
ncbi:type I restriction endonuclease [Argonema antarcticum]|uniref:type I restriction endonuclease n=1 Tax=Argonema antarcticum TaxID=2942763 RepID=UPI00201303B0|nr:type I restriction endonuclease [Argonema antarcticum]MCL1474309.1 restriction endonuclease subunit R [Argonema antarcticum A004/B2]